MDREHPLEEFDRELDRVGEGPRMLNVTGVGGIGKSRLLHEMRRRVESICRTAVLDLQVPVMRQQEDALALLRREFGRQHVRFTRFDIAYAVLWQRLHPHLQITAAGLPLVSESEVLSEIFADASGVPVFGTAVGLLKLVDRAARRQRRRRRTRLDETLSQLDALSNAEVVDAVTYMFAGDLREASADRPYVLFIDSYDALVPAPVRAGQPAADDEWLRDLVAQLDRGLVVTASREPVGWEYVDTSWSGVIRELPVGGLPMAARLELLADSGVAEPGARRTLAHASAGVPFYLHLAADTRQQAAGRLESLVSSEEILRRFLRNVSRTEVRFLELLSIARTFDFEIFQALADAFDLPGNRLAWEALTAYSFVHPVGDGAFQAHQLMRTALRRRLGSEVQVEVHALLRSVWEQRNAEASGSLARAAGLREAAYHGLHAGEFGGVDLLGHADDALNFGGRQMATGVLEDLRDYLAESPQDEDTSPDGRRGELARTRLCMEVEAAILMGEARLVATLTEGVTLRSESLVDTRIAVAAANARRILGETTAALRMYSDVWTTRSGPDRLAAGHWAADLHMCQGRFDRAAVMVAEIRKTCPEDRQEMLGDVERLMHLANRFAFDFNSATECLNRAEEHYRSAGSIVGLANVLTNWAELLAFVEPEASLEWGARALAVQGDLGAQHEIGKAHTALGIAQTLLVACQATLAGYSVQVRMGESVAKLVLGPVLALRQRM